MGSATLQRARRLLIRSWWSRTVACLLAVLLIFSLGVEVGNGRVSVSFLSSVKSENPGLPAQLD